MGAVGEDEPTVVFLTRGEDTPSPNIPVWGFVPIPVSVNDERIVKIDGTLWRARVAVLRTRQAHSPDGCQFVDFELLRPEPPKEP